MIEFIIGGAIAIAIIVYLVVNNKSKNEDKDINSTVLELPPKPPRDAP